MEALELLDIISLGETSTVQFKRTLDSTDKLAAELCALANSEGGMILFGVENDGSIGGLEPSEVRELNSRIASVASEKIREPLFPYSEVVKMVLRRLMWNSQLFFKGPSPVVDINLQKD